MKNKYRKLLFEYWMENNHPLFFPIVGIIGIIIGIGFISSVILLIFDIEWWWKVSLISLVVFFTFKYITHIIIKEYIDEFERKT